MGLQNLLVQNVSTEKLLLDLEAGIQAAQPDLGFSLACFRRLRPFLGLLRSLLRQSQARISPIGPQAGLVRLGFGSLGTPFSALRLQDGALNEGTRLLYNLPRSVPFTTDLRAHIADQLDCTRPVRVQLVRMGVKSLQLSKEGNDILRGGCVRRGP
ncbi:hypothetical protein OCOJLMKI_2240 [Methylobacterium iners]|uniref:Uncharacterized protein n=1 Tax=Methylobacterium iners TaxID=418707 RepID=A0ABQ4RW03_9HYPH|nr:hypothetical protein OCOJLMKI_2240 [Methylobacterium iners]